MKESSQCSLSWLHRHSQRQRYAHHDSLLSYFCLSASMPNWLLLYPLPRQEYSSNWAGSGSHALRSHSTPPFSSLSLPPGDQGKKCQSMIWSHASCAVLTPTELNSNRDLGVLWDLHQFFLFPFFLAARGLWACLCDLLIEKALTDSNNCTA